MNNRNSTSKNRNLVMVKIIKPEKNEKNYPFLLQKVLKKKRLKLLLNLINTVNI